MLNFHLYMLQVYDPTSVIHQAAFHAAVRRHNYSNLSRPKEGHRILADKLIKMGYGVQLEEAVRRNDVCGLDNTIAYSTLTFDIYIGDLLVGKYAGNVLHMTYLLPGITYLSIGYDIPVVHFRKDFDRGDLKRAYDAIHRVRDGVEISYEIR